MPLPHDLRTQLKDVGLASALASLDCMLYYPAQAPTVPEEARTVRSPSSPLHFGIRWGRGINGCSILLQGTFWSRFHFDFVLVIWFHRPTYSLKTDSGNPKLWTLTHHFPPMQGEIDYGVLYPLRMERERLHLQLALQLTRSGKLSNQLKVGIPTTWSDGMR